MSTRARHKVQGDEEGAREPGVLLRLEELINLAMGPPGMNVVSFKLVQTVLLILARQMRLLDQQVELRQPEDALTDDDVKDNEDAERRKKEKAEKRAAKEERASKRDKNRDGKTELEEDVRSVKNTKSEKVGKTGHDDNTKSVRSTKGDIVGREEDTKSTNKHVKGENDGQDKTANSTKAEKSAKGGQDDDIKSTKSTKAEKSAKGGQDDDTKSTKSTKAEKSAKGGQDDDTMSTKSAKGDITGKGEKEEDTKSTKSAKAEKAEKTGQEKYESKSGKESKSKGKTRDVDEDEGKSQAASDATSIKSKKDLGRRSSVVSVTERQGSGKETILVVEKSRAPSRVESVSRVGSVEVVPLEQFRQLQRVVAALKERAGPLPPPALPDNPQLRDDIAHGRASLTDTMHAMQLTARVAAAEEAIAHMSQLLTALASAGALPDDLVDAAGQLQGQVQLVKGDIARATGGGGGGGTKDKDVASIASKKSLATVKSVAVHPEVTTVVSATSQVQAKGGTPSIGAPGPGGGGGGVAGGQGPLGVGSVASHGAPQGASGARPTLVSASTMPAAVSKGEMNEALKVLRNELTSNMTTVTTKATAAADTALTQAKALAEKMEVAVKLNNRVNALYGLVSDYNEQLSGFDAGLTTQMQGFQEQMMQLRNDLRAGLAQLEAVNSNAETAAVLELTERYNGLVTEFCSTRDKHTLLTDYHKQLSDQLKGLVECVEMMREQKADRDEVMDGLRDKADLSRLAGLLTEQEFALAREELERRLEVCHDKFRRQEKVWKMALKDFADITATKAEMMELMSARDHAEQQLKELHDNVHKLAVLLGDPKAAILCRKLSKEGACAVCRGRALMDGAATDGPPRLAAACGGVQRPVLHPDALEAAACARWVPRDHTDDDKVHWCTRYCGGSHTLVQGGRARAPPAPPVLPAVRGEGPGADGRMYRLERPLVPCRECNHPAPPLPGEADRVVAAGDSVSVHHHVTMPAAAVGGERPLGGDAHYHWECYQEPRDGGGGGGAGCPPRRPHPRDLTAAGDRQL